MKRNKIYAWMAVAMTLAACSTNDIADITANDADNVVNIASVTRSGETGNTTAQQMTAPFHLVNVTQMAKFDMKYEADYTFDNNTYSVNGLVVWCNSYDNEFQAFSPLHTSANNASFTNFTIPTDQSTTEKLAAADWMTATKTLTKLKADNSVNSLDLNFEHKNAKLHFNVTINDDAAALTSNNIKVLGAITPYYNSTDNSKTIEAIVKPGVSYTTSNEIIEIAITNGETYSLNFPSATTLEAGKQYNFNLVIGHNATTISSVSVTDWGKEEIDLQGKDDATLFIPYVTFTSESEVKFNMTTTTYYNISDLEYSVNNGNWTSIPGSGISDIPFGGTKGKLRLRGKSSNGTATSSLIYAAISFTPSNENTNATVACTGDIRTLLDYENYKNVNTSNARFCRLFNTCTQLTSAPELPATTLASACYSYMFNGCKSLTTAPELPATTLADGCYYSMFFGCTSLTIAPELKAETLAESCYNSMFYGCTSLTEAPELPATTLAKSCYQSMFDLCTSLTEAPELKATTLDSYCYNNMFNGCKKLQSVTMLATNVSASDCLKNWLNGAGTEASSRTLTVANQAAYNAIKNNLPDIWQSGEGKATVIYKDGNTQ